MRYFCSASDGDGLALLNDREPELLDATALNRFVDLASKIAEYAKFGEMHFARL